MTSEQRQELFNYMLDQHGVALLEFDMNDIECIVKGKKQYFKEANKAMKIPSIRKSRIVQKDTRTIAC